MAHKLTITLRAKNAIAAGVKSAERSLNAMANGIGSAMRTAGKWILGIGASVAAFSAKALSAWGEQEKATTSLKSAFRAYGEEVDANVAKLSELASAIQDETAVGDEVTVARMARLKMLGMETAMLGPAAKGVIALAEAGMDETAAMKALVSAQNGEFTMLQRYLPALKTATTEAEKAAIVNDFLTRGYQASKDRLNTVAGSWEALKGRVGDMWEEVGKVLAQDVGLQNMLTVAGEKIKELTKRFAEWAASGGMVNLIADVKMFAENMRDSFTKGAIYAKGFFMGGIIEPGKQAWQYASSVGSAWWTATKALFTLAGDYAEAMWQKIKNPWRKFETPDMGPYKKAMDDFWLAAVGDKVDKSAAFTEMFASLEAEEKKHAAAVLAISEAQLAGLAAINKKRVDNEKKAMEQITIAAENQAAKIAELQKKAAEIRGKIADVEAGQIKDAAKERETERLEAGIARFGKEADKQNEIAGMSVDEWIKNQTDKGNAKIQAASDAARRDRLEGVVKRGDRSLSFEERNWLMAQRGIDTAKLAAEIATGEQRKLQLELKDLQKADAANLKDLRDSALRTEGKITELMQAKGRA